MPNDGEELVSTAILRLELEQLLRRCVSGPLRDAIISEIVERIAERDPELLEQMHRRIQERRGR